MTLPPPSSRHLIAHSKHYPHPDPTRTNRHAHQVCTYTISVCFCMDVHVAMSLCIRTSMINTMITASAPLNLIAHSKHYPHPDPTPTNRHAHQVCTYTISVCFCMDVHVAMSLCIRTSMINTMITASAPLNLIAHSKHYPHPDPTPTNRHAHQVCTYTISVCFCMDVHVAMSLCIRTSMINTMITASAPLYLIAHSKHYPHPDPTQTNCLFT